MKCCCAIPGCTLGRPSPSTCYPDDRTSAHTNRHAACEHQLLSLLQVQVRDENGRVLGGHKILDATITGTSSVGDFTFVVEGQVGPGGEGWHPHHASSCDVLLRKWRETGQ